MLEGDTSKKGGDILLETDEKHKGGLSDDNVRMVGDVEQSGGVDGDQPEGIECQFKRGVCLRYNIKEDKQRVRSKRWGKVKTGYGWIHSSKVRYSYKAEWSEG